jgi:uncharacterized membrane protein
METERETFPSSLRVASIAVLTALTVVIGYIRVPLPATKGIFTLADIAIYLAAYAFGPYTAAVAGGLGTGLIDLIGGTAQFAPASLLVHGLEGLLAGLVASAGARRAAPVVLWILAGACGTVVMTGGYLLAETLFYGGFALALTEVPFNLAQSVVGVVGGSLLTVAVRRAYPPMRRLRW